MYRQKWNTFRILEFHLCTLGFRSWHVGHCVPRPAFVHLMDEAHYFTRGRSRSASASRFGVHSSLGGSFAESRGTKSPCCSWARRCQLLAAGATGLCRTLEAISSRAIPRGICHHRRCLQVAEAAISKCTRRGRRQRPRQAATKDGGARCQFCATARGDTRHGLCRSGPRQCTKTHGIFNADCPWDRPSEPHQRFCLNRSNVQWMRVQ